MAKITASFIDFGVEWNTPFGYPACLDAPDFWRQELADMREAGITDVIPARIMEMGRTHYHSSIFQEWDETDHVARIMSAAGELGMGVYLGQHLCVGFWDRRFDFARMMARDLNANLRIYDELLAVYRRHPALRGIYVSNEPDRDNIDTPERADVLRESLHSFYTHVKADSGLPVLVSPFFSKSLPPEELAAWWDTFLDRPLFDMLAMQDGVGCYPRRDLHVEEIPPYYAALAPVYRRHGITFWNNVETFAWPLPGPLERIARQYEAGRPFVSRSITWEYGHFLSRQQVSEERYQAFKAWNLG